MAGEQYVKDNNPKDEARKKKVLSPSTSDMKIQVQKQETDESNKKEDGEDEVDALKKSASGTAIGDDTDEEEPADMRSVLGFLNQAEWIGNLNIGNIMQIQAFCMKDFLTVNRDESELARDCFLEKLSILTVSYFCMSTEMRFLL